MRILCSSEIEKNSRIMDIFTKAASLCMEGEGLSPINAEISLSFVSQEEIQRLNKMYRNIDNYTDVLSFPMIEDFNLIHDGEEILLGDVVICTEQAKRQAEEYGHCEEREFVYLFVHRVLHLLGYDHMNEQEKADMRKREEEIMSELGLERKMK